MAPTRPQQPIFERKPELRVPVIPPKAKRAHQVPAAETPKQEFVTQSLVTPLCIFAAGRDSFECIVRVDFEKADALAVIFSHLQLQENGWSFDATDIQAAGTRAGWPVWRVSRVLP